MKRRMGLWKTLVVAQCLPSSHFRVSHLHSWSRACQALDITPVFTIYSFTPLWYRVCSNASFTQNSFQICTTISYYFSSQTLFGPSLISFWRMAQKINTIKIYSVVKWRKPVTFTSLHVLLFVLAIKAASAA